MGWLDSIGGDTVTVGDLSIGSVWNTAAQAQQLPGLGQLTGPDTLTSDVLTSQGAPTDPSAGNGGAYGAFMSALGKVAGTVTNTELARYQAGRALKPGQSVGPTGAPVDATQTTVQLQAQARQRTMLMVGGMALAGFVLYRLAAK